jgi:hypothetical protein
VTELFHSQRIDYFVQRSARDLLHTNIPGTNGSVSCEWRMADDAWDRQKSFATSETRTDNLRKYSSLLDNDLWGGLKDGITAAM